MDYPVARRKMVETQVKQRGVHDPHVLEAMGRVPRHEFVPQGMGPQAYEDRPLNIGLKQTVSQPFMVGFMTQALQLKGMEKVLEIGTGSGYQTAILCELAQKVYSVERLKELSHQARKVLYRLGYVNFELKVGDGTLGWPEQGPFDAILVTAAAPTIPSPLQEQLVKGGRLLVPVGGEMTMELIRWVRGESEKLGECRFVKLFGEYGWA